MIDWDSVVAPPNNELTFATVEALSARLNPIMHQSKTIVVSTPERRLELLNPHSLFSMEIIVDKNIPHGLKYPTGHKDGNKLGRRKREMKVNTIFIVNKDMFNFEHTWMKGKMI